MFRSVPWSSIRWAMQQTQVCFFAAVEFNIRQCYRLFSALFFSTPFPCGIFERVLRWRYVLGVGLLWREAMLVQRCDVVSRGSRIPQWSHHLCRRVNCHDCVLQIHVSIVGHRLCECHIFVASVKTQICCICRQRSCNRRCVCTVCTYCVYKLYLFEQLHTWDRDRWAKSPANCLLVAESSCYCITAIECSTFWLSGVLLMSTFCCLLRGEFIDGWHA